MKKRTYIQGKLGAFPKADCDEAIGEGSSIIAPDRLRRVREARGFTKRRLAKALDVPLAVISQVENGDDVALDLLRLYIRALGGKLVLRITLP